jgi:hypothetical protein
MHTDKSHLRLVTGSEDSTAFQAPEITSPEEASRYCEETATRYKVEMAKAQTSTSIDEARSAFRKGLMLYGRALAGPDIFYRLRILDWFTFIDRHNALTGSMPTSEQAAVLTHMKNRQHARDYLRTHLALLKQKRKATIPRQGLQVEEQQKAYQKWLVHLGQFLEAAALLLRQRLIDTGEFEKLQEEALATLVPTLT